MAQNTFATVTVENAVMILTSLKSLNRPLTAEEKLAGRKAAMFVGENIKNRIKALQEEEVEYLMKHGFTEDEARKQLRLNMRNHNEEIGLGKSQRCRFTKIPNKSKKFTKAC